MVKLRKVIGRLGSTRPCAFWKIAPSAVSGKPSAPKVVLLVLSTVASVRSFLK
ncbi:hypothetical protein D3C86_1858470 [compost metagenome]